MIRVYIMCFYYSLRNFLQLGAFFHSESKIYYVFEIFVRCKSVGALKISTKQHYPAAIDIIHPSLRAINGYFDDLISLHLQSWPELNLLESHPLIHYKASKWASTQTGKIQRNGSRKRSRIWAFALWVVLYKGNWYIYFFRLWCRRRMFQHFAREMLFCIRFILSSFIKIHFNGWDRMFGQ